MNELNFALQKKGQEILNAMILVKTAKKILEQMRDNGWRDLMNDVHFMIGSSSNTGDER